MTILSLPFCLERFMTKFYSFQIDMNITNQHCFHNVRYLVEYLADYNIKCKSVNGFLIMKQRNTNGKIETRKIEHNWIEYDGDIIEPNKEINDTQYKKYFLFSQKNKMYNSMETSQREKMEDIVYQKDHLKKYMTKSFGIHLQYENMLWSRKVNQSLCNKINGDIYNYNMMEKMKQMGCKVFYM